MKKNYFTFFRGPALLTALIFASFLHAADEFIFENADDVTTDEWAGWSWNGTAEKVANPLVNSDNESANVWKFNAPSAWAGFATGNEAGLGIDFSVYSRFECLVYCPNAINSIQLLIMAEGNENKELDLGYVTCNNGWAVASGNISTWTGNYTKFVIKNGENTAGLDIYFDDIKFVNPDGANEIILDNAETHTQTWDWSWGGMSHSIVANPKIDVVNPTAYVTEMISTAEWSGLEVGYNSSTVDEQINFSVFSQFEMLVYCPNVETLQLIIGLDDTNLDFEINKVATSGWVKITQDVSVWAGHMSNKFCIKNGSGTADVPIYIDEIKFVKPSSSNFTDQVDLKNNTVFFNGNVIIMNSDSNFNYTLYNTVGRVVAQGQSTTSTASVETYGFAMGVYIVKMNVNGYIFNKKISIY